MPERFHRRNAGTLVGSIVTAAFSLSLLAPGGRADATGNQVTPFSTSTPDSNQRTPTLTPASGQPTPRIETATQTATATATRMATSSVTRTVEPTPFSKDDCIGKGIYELCSPEIHNFVSDEGVFLSESWTALSGRLNNQGIPILTFQKDFFYVIRINSHSFNARGDRTNIFVLTLKQGDGKEHAVNEQYVRDRDIYDSTEFQVFASGSKIHRYWLTREVFSSGGDRVFTLEREDSPTTPAYLSPTMGFGGGIPFDLPTLTPSSSPYPRNENSGSSGGSEPVRVESSRTPNPTAAPTARPVFTARAENTATATVVRVIETSTPPAVIAFIQPIVPAEIPSQPEVPISPAPEQPVQNAEPTLSDVIDSIVRNEPEGYNSAAYLDILTALGIVHDLGKDQLTQEQFLNLWWAMQADWYGEPRPQNPEEREKRLNQIVSNQLGIEQPVEETVS